MAADFLMLLLDRPLKRLAEIVANALLPIVVILQNYSFDQTKINIDLREKKNRKNNMN